MNMPILEADVEKRARVNERRQDLIEYITQLLREIVQIAEAAKVDEIRSAAEKAYYEASKVCLLEGIRRDGRRQRPALELQMRIDLEDLPRDK